jgi:hypothetical protein
VVRPPAELPPIRTPRDCVTLGERSKRMYVEAIHRISDPEKFFAVAQETIAALPDGVTVQQMFPSVDGTTAVCLWQAPSVDAVRKIVDGASAGVAVNEFFEISPEQAVGLK